MTDHTRFAFGSANAPSGKIDGAVIDIESVVDEDAAAWSGSPTPARRAALHRVICVSVLRFTQDALHGEISGLDLRTFNADEHAEAEIIGFTDRMLPDGSREGSRLVSWNGKSSDLRLLRHRACANWMFALPNLRSWCDPEARFRHVDMMVDANVGLGRGDWWALRDVCAGLSVSLRPGPSLSISQARLAGNSGAVALRNRRDVVGTLLTYANWESFRRGCPLAAASAWRAVSGLKGIDPERPDGTANLAQHHMVEVAMAHYRRADEQAIQCGCRTEQKTAKPTKALRSR